MKQNVVGESRAAAGGYLGPLRLVEPTQKRNVQTC
jgi:hypothetical protein